jgi:hypothetical protein
VYEDARAGDDDVEVVVMKCRGLAVRGSVARRIRAIQVWVAEADRKVVGFVGGDSGHAAARRVHLNAGSTPLPVARYFKAL